MEVEVLRLGHRHIRDARVTTHLFLTARAFGSSKVIYSGRRDRKLEEKMYEVNKTWGGPFAVEYRRDWKNKIVEWKERNGEIIHLTFYGLPVQDVIHQIRNSVRDKLIIVGGAKVPRIVYNLSDWNLAITSQPHSEVSALSVFLHELFEGRELSKIFKNAKLRIMPQRRGKKVVRS